MRYTEWVITFTSLSCSCPGLLSDACSLSSPGFWSAPSFLSFCLARSSGEVVLIKAIILLSGDHTGAPTPRGKSVTFQDSPPLMESMYSCGPAGRLEALAAPAPEGRASGARTKVSHFPSGDHWGEESWLPLPIRIGCSSPRIETLQIEVS